MATRVPALIQLSDPRVAAQLVYNTGIIRFFTKQIATGGFSTVFGQSRCALGHTKSIKPRQFGNIVKMRLENDKIPYSPHVKSCGKN